MSEKHKSGSSASANWNLSSFWRPLSQNSFLESSGDSVRDGFAPPWYSIVPSIFSGRRSAAPPSESDSKKGTETLLSPEHAICRPGRQRSTSSGTDESTFGTFGPVSRPTATAAPTTARSLQADAFDRLVRLKTISSRRSSRRYLHRIQYVPSLTEHGERSDPAVGQDTGIPDRPQFAKISTLRDPSLPISELPGLSTSPLASKKTAISEVQPLDPVPPPAPPKSAHQSAQNKLDHRLVRFSPTDPDHATDWSTSKKWLATVSISLVVFCVALASTITSPATQKISTHFHTVADVVVLDRALFMLGIALGTIVWVPLSDRYGRQLPTYVGFVSFLIFMIPIAVAENLTTIFVCRFIAGFFGCAAITSIIAAVADLWDPPNRSIPMSALATAIIAGAACGPLIGGSIVDNATLGWRWCSWIVLILGVVFGLCCWVFFAETSSSAVLRHRAKKLRRLTGDSALHVPADETDVNSKVFMERYIFKPLTLMFTEPILFLVVLYVSYALGLLYLFVEVFRISYASQRGWNLEDAGLPFLAIIFGVLLGCFINFLFARLRQRPLMKKHGRHSPEEVLLPLLVGSVALPIGLLMFGWTSSRHVRPAAEIASGVFLGIGFLLIFLQGTNYLLDVYSLHSGAAIAITTTVSSLFAASFGVFASYMFAGMGFGWASTLLALVSIILIPIPVVLFKRGVKIRAMSNFATKLSH